MNSPITFPGLHLSFDVSAVAFSVGSLTIKWYGILIALGLFLALMYGLKRSKEFNITVDDLIDVILFSIIFAIIGARLYFVLFYTDAFGSNMYFSDPLSILKIWQGGLGIYGGIIAAFLTGFIVCKKKKISVGSVFDIAALGFLIGQGIGRWGNFFNREAYGAATSLPWRMTIDATGVGYHPCFLYESLWCLLGFVILHIYSSRRKFNGEIFLMYVMWYGTGRFFIEGLRTDSLMLGTMKVSQIVALVSFFAALALIIYKRKVIRQAVANADTSYTPVYDDAARALKEEQSDDDKTDDANPDESNSEPESDGSENTPADNDGSGKE